jgi:GNAT superfamily N-acetyltransferase
MATIEIVDLTPGNLVDSPQLNTRHSSCRYCLYWEYPGQFCPKKLPDDQLLRAKSGWLYKTRASFGSCGRVAYVDGIAAGYAQYAPPELLPRVSDYTAGPPSLDAVFISCLFIAQDQLRGLGVGRQLLKSILADLENRGIGVVETFGRRGSADNPSGPVEFYLKHGFRVLRDDPDFPLLRLELW